MIQNLTIDLDEFPEEKQAIYTAYNSPQRTDEVLYRIARGFAESILLAPHRDNREIAFNIGHTCADDGKFYIGLVWGYREPQSCINKGDMLYFPDPDLSCDRRCFRVQPNLPVFNFRNSFPPQIPPTFSVKILVFNRLHIKMGQRVFHDYWELA